MATPYEVHELGINVTGGQTVCVPVPFPSRTFVGKLVVCQTGGVGGAFVVECLNRSLACEGLSVANDEGEGPGPAPIDLYRVMPKLTNVPPAHHVEAFATGLGWPFFNMDGDVGMGNPRVIYIQISPPGTGLKEFAIAINGTCDLV